MKRNTAIFIQAVIVLIGIGALIFMLWEPHLEGRNANATFFEVYFNDPFLAYAYVASIAFFVALYKAFMVLGYVGQNDLYSQAAANALRTIRNCALILIGFLVGAEAYLFIVMRKIEEDIAGGVMMGLVMILGSTAVAVAAGLFERKVRRVVEGVK